MYRLGLGCPYYSSGCARDANPCRTTSTVIAASLSVRRATAAGTHEFFVMYYHRRMLDSRWTCRLSGRRDPKQRIRPRRPNWTRATCRCFRNRTAWTLSARRGRTSPRPSKDLERGSRQTREVTDDFCVHWTIQFVESRTTDTDFTLCEHNLLCRGDLDDLVI